MTEPNPNKTRLLGPDAARTLLIPLLAVVHSTPFRHWEGDGYRLLSVLLDQLPRFGIPALIIFSGYFFGRKYHGGAAPWPMAARLSGKLALLYLVWCLAYLTPYNLGAMVEFGPLGPFKFGYWNLRDWLSSPQMFLLVGPKIHLWFLPSLLCAFFLSGLVLRWCKVEVLLLLSAGIYVVGVLAGPYVVTAAGMGWFPLDTRNGPFFSMLPFASGVWLARSEAGPRWFWPGVGLALAGGAVHALEVYMLWANHGIDPYLDYVFGTYLYGLGCAMVFLSSPRFLQLPRVASLGHFTLGIYTTHYFFIDIFAPVDRATQHVLWELGQPLLVYLAALGLTLLMNRSRYTRWMVG